MLDTIIILNLKQIISNGWMDIKCINCSKSKENIPFFEHTNVWIFRFSNLMLSSVRKLNQLNGWLFFWGCQLSVWVKQNEKTKSDIIDRWGNGKTITKSQRFCWYIYLCGSNWLYRFVLTSWFLREVHFECWMGQWKNTNFDTCIRIWF